MLKLTLDDIFYYWEITLFLEKFADQIKRIPRYYTDLKPNLELVKLYSRIINYYEMAMKAHYTKNVDLTIEVMIGKRDVFKQCDAFTASLPKDYSYVLEKIRNMNTNTSNLSKVLLKLYKHSL